MPMKPMKPCSHYGCRNLTRERYCSVHRKEGKQWAGDQQYHKWYMSKTWKTIRSIHLSNNPLCVMCQRDGRITKGNEVDHIIPFNDWQSFIDMDNLQTLCRPCHLKKINQSRGKK